MSENKYTEVEGIDATTYAGKAALAVKKKARGILGDELVIFTLVKFVQFMQLNNKFNALGIQITEDNKEECYIQIIEMEKPELIDDLELYIDLNDEINDIVKKKDEYTGLIDKLQNSLDPNDSEAINSIVESYLRR
jgi:hypothetical protein